MLFITFDPLKEQLNSITCNPDDYTCADGTVFTDGCTNLPYLQCNNDGSYQALYTDAAVDNLLPLYQDCDTV